MNAQIIPFVEEAVVDRFWGNNFAKLKVTVLIIQHG